MGMVRAVSSLLIALVVHQAQAGAWTRTEGDAFVSQSVRYFSTALTGDGAPFSRLSSQTYVEYGVTDQTTVGGEADAGRRADGTQDSLLRGFLRVRLWRGENGVVSIEGGGAYPALSALSGDTAIADVTPEARIGLAYGRGIALRDWGGWAEAGLTARHRFGPPADEVKLDLTLGIRPTDDWVAIGQVFATMGLRNEGVGGSNFDAIKLSLAIGRRLDDRRTLLFFAAQDLWGRNLNKGGEIGVTIWNEF
ncbi:MAG: hypothetical protein AAF401_05510 [Pseudomonadota bacterium]